MTATRDQGPGKQPRAEVDVNVSCLEQTPDTTLSGATGCSLPTYILSRAAGHRAQYGGTRGGIGWGRRIVVDVVGGGHAVAATVGGEMLQTVVGLTDTLVTSSVSVMQRGR